MFCAALALCAIQGVAVDLKLYRLDQTARGIFGELHVGDARFTTVERPYLDNKPFVSSVPAGKYELRPHESQQHGATWALVNEDEGVYQYPNPAAKRYAILIHVANKPSELAGCIGVGKFIGFVDGQFAVTKSGVAMVDVLNALSRQHRHTLTIIDKQEK